MLDWIEGRLSAEQQAAAEQASGRAGVSERVRQMQANRRALQNLSAVAAPEDLLERVVGALERQQLVGPAQQPEAPAPIVMADRIHTAGWGSRIPGFALAAGLALLVGGGVYLSMTVGQNHQSPAPSGGSLAKQSASGPLAKAEREEPTVGLKSSSKEAPAPVAPSETLAMNGTMQATGVSVAADTAEPSPVQVAAATVPADISPERAAELAQEGRLVMRVLSTNTDNLAQIEKQGAQNGSPRTWRLRKDVPPALAAAVVPTGPRAADPGPSEVIMASDDTRRLAAETLIAPFVGPRAAFNVAPPSPNDPLTRVKGTYLLEAPGTPKSLETLRGYFAEKLRGGVVFEELPPALAVDTAPGPEATLWWTQAPSQWFERVSVPMVVEQR